MKFDLDNWDYFKKVIIKHRIVIITIMIICLLLGIFFSIRNSFVYVAKTSLIFGRVKPQDQVVSSIVQNNNDETENQEDDSSQEVDTTSTDEVSNSEEVLANSSLEQNISLSNINIDSNALKTCQALIISDNLMDKLKSKLELEESVKSLKKSISISKLKSSNVLILTVKNNDSSKACDISNTMAQIFSEEAKNIYNLDKVYIIDSADINDIEKTGFSAWYIILWIFIGILLNVLYIAIRQLNVVNMNITKLVKFINSKIKVIKNIISSKVHKAEIRELPSGEELDENYKVINNKSIIDSDLVHSDQPSIDNDISTDIEEFNSKTDTYNDSVASIPITDEKVKEKIKENIPEKAEAVEEKSKSLSEKGAEIKDEVLKKIKSKTKKDDTKINVESISENQTEKKVSKKIGKEEAMSIKAQEELIALREENNQKIKDDRNKIDSQAQIQKRLNEEIEARKKLEIELELQKKAMEQERIQMEEKIKKELKKQLLEEQRKTLEEEERIAYEIEMREQEEEQRIMEEERLKMLREKEERKEQLKQERMEKRIIRAEIRQKRAEERAKQRIIAKEERNRIQAIKREEKQKLREQKEAERQEIIRKYYEEKNNKEIANQQQIENMSIDNTPKEEIDIIEENKINNYSAIKRIKEKSNGNKDFSEDYIQDNLYPKFKL